MIKKRKLINFKTIFSLQVMNKLNNYKINNRMIFLNLNYKNNQVIYFNLK